MNKKVRHELKMLKYRKRLKYWASIWRTHTTQDGDEIINPTVNDLVNDKAYLHLKTQATMCSCYMCSKYYKYRRNEFRVETQRILREDLGD